MSEYTLHITTNQEWGGGGGDTVSFLSPSSSSLPLPQTPTALHLPLIYAASRASVKDMKGCLTDI